jgi:hypothetical protein
MTIDDEDEGLSDASRLGRMLYMASLVLDVQVRIVADLTRPGDAQPEYLAGVAAIQILAAKARDALGAVGVDVTDYEDIDSRFGTRSNIASIIASYAGEVSYYTQRIEMHYYGRMSAQDKGAWMLDDGSEGAR